MRKFILRLVISILLIVIIASGFLIKFFSIDHYNILNEAAEKYDVDVFLLAAIAKVESNFEEKAVSKAGALGVMQVLPTTALWMSEVFDLNYEESLLYDKQYNIDMGARYFSYLLDQYSGDRAKSLAAYNAGSSNIDQWLKESTWDGTVQDIDSVPFAETKKYIAKVEFFYKAYSMIYNKLNPLLVSLD